MAEWGECFTPERQKDFIYRIGNLTLLEASLNRQVGNDLLVEKAPIYAKSGYEITRAISAEDGDEWTPAKLAERQQRMAKRAVHVWRSDFD